MTNAIKMLLQMQNGFFATESTLSSKILSFWYFVLHNIKYSRELYGEW
jgi:protein tyrosine phosphatase